METEAYAMRFPLGDSLRERLPMAYQLDREAHGAQRRTEWSCWVTLGLEASRLEILDGSPDWQVAIQFSLRGTG